MPDREDDRFERNQGDWALSLFLLVVSLVLFFVFYPKNGFVYGDKGIIYLNCLILGLFGWGFYRVFLRPYALRFTPEGTLLIQSVLFPKSLAIDWIESVHITEVPSRNGPKTVYTLQIKNGDPVVIPPLGSMDVFIEKIAAMNGHLKVLDERLK
jgi:hypothetical protein